MIEVNHALHKGAERSRSLIGVALEVLEGYVTNFSLHASGEVGHRPQTLQLP